MRIFGKDIADECQYCGDILQCELFRQGHGIRQERNNITRMFACQMEHNRKREKLNEPETAEKESGAVTPEVKEIYTAIWKIHKKNFKPETDADWEQINRECKLLLKMYDCQFARELIQAMIAEIEHRMKKDS